MRRPITHWLVIAALLLQGWAMSSAHASFDAKTAMQHHCSEQLKASNGDSCCDESCALTMDCHAACLTIVAVPAIGVSHSFVSAAFEFAPFSQSRIPSPAYTPLSPPPIS